MVTSSRSPVGAIDGPQAGVIQLEWHMDRSFTERDSTSGPAQGVYQDAPRNSSSASPLPVRRSDPGPQRMGRTRGRRSADSRVVRQRRAVQKAAQPRRPRRFCAESHPTRQGVSQGRNPPCSAKCGADKPRRKKSRNPGTADLGDVKGDSTCCGCRLWICNAFTLARTSPDHKKAIWNVPPAARRRFAVPNP